MVGVSEKAPILEVKDLRTYFPITSGMWRRVVGYVRAVDGVSFDLHEGETLGLVGESGCGKTTAGRAIIRAVEPTGGEVYYRASDDTVIEATTAEGDTLRTLRQQIQIIFQDPFASLNPRMTIYDIVADPMRVNRLASGSELEGRVEEMLQLVGMSPALMRRYPHAFSGGQRQRIGIARSLVMNPRLVIADEPVSALDVSVQAQILNLMLDLQSDLGLTYLFISHDLSVVQYISHRVAVMYVGKIVELAPTEQSVHAAETSLYASAAVVGAGAAPGRAFVGRATGGGGGRSGEPAEWMLLPSTLSFRAGGVPDDGAGVRRGRARPLRALPLRG